MFWSGWKNRGVNRERILALDLLRGTFLVVIITTHIAWSPSLFTFVGGGGGLPASAAEGFFAISGLLVGYLYAPRILNETKKVFKKIWRRAGLLYILAVFFTFFYTAWAALDPGSAKYATLYDKGEVKFLINTLSLRYAFGWADYLTRYAVFMLFAPFALWLVAKHRAWIVATTSFLIWLLFRETEVFLPFSAWQLVFTFGMILGYYLPHLESLFYSLSKPKQRTIFRGALMATYATYAFSIVIFVIAVWLPAHPQVLELRELLVQYFNKDHLAPARVAVGTLWFITLYMFYRRYEKEISKKTYGILEVLGRQSLFVYCLHAFILFAIDLYLIPPQNSNKIINTLVTFAVLVVIYLAAKYRGSATAYGKRLLNRRATTQVP